MQSLRFGKYWLGAGMLIVILTLYFTLAPASRIITVAFMSDKASHALAFLILMVWFSGLFRKAKLPWVAISLLLYGALIELVQSRLPYRTAEVGDLVFDLGGIMAGWGLAIAGLRHWAVKFESWLPARSV